MTPSLLFFGKFSLTIKDADSKFNINLAAGMPEIVTQGLILMGVDAAEAPHIVNAIADWTGVAETELFAKTYKSYGLNTVRYRVLEITATVEPFENGRGHTLRVLRAGKPRKKQR